MTWVYICAQCQYIPRMVSGFIVKLCRGNRTRMLVCWSIVHLVPQLSPKTNDSNKRPCLHIRQLVKQTKRKSFPFFPLLITLNNTTIDFGGPDGQIRGQLFQMWMFHNHRDRLPRRRWSTLIWNTLPLPIDRFVVCSINGWPNGWFQCLGLFSCLLMFRASLHFRQTFVDSLNWNSASIHKHRIWPSSSWWSSTCTCPNLTSRFWLGEGDLCVQSIGTQTDTHTSADHYLSKCQTLCAIRTNDVPDKAPNKIKFWMNHQKIHSKRKWRRQVWMSALASIRFVRFILMEEVYFRIFLSNLQILCVG